MENQVISNIFSKKPVKRFSLFAAAASVLILYCLAVNVIENFSSLGYRPQFCAEDLSYHSNNRIFDEYTPTINVTLNVNSHERLINTKQRTVGEILEDSGIYLDENDDVNLPLDSVAEDDSSIVVRKIDTYDITLTEVIAHATDTKYIHTIPAGTKRVITEGSDGLVTRVVRQKYINGKLESESIVSEEIIQKPVTKVVQVGLGGTFTAPNGKKYAYSYYLDVEATAYGGEQFSGLTYTGVQVATGMIAVDPEYIPLKSKVYVIGDAGDFGVCCAEDIGAGIIGNSIDIYMGNDMDAMVKFGRQPMRVYILK